jgi:hypothetical protein
MVVWTIAELFAFDRLRDRLCAARKYNLGTEAFVADADSYNWALVNSPSKMKHLILLSIMGFAFLSLTARAQTGENVEVRAGIDHSEFDRLLKKYVNERGLVNYTGWKQNVADLTALDNYLSHFAAKIDSPAVSNEKAASLVNAYNAFVLRWILKTYPTESIWQLKNSFDGKRNDIGGRKAKTCSGLRAPARRGKCDRPARRNSRQCK